MPFSVRAKGEDVNPMLLTPHPSRFFCENPSKSGMYNPSETRFSPEPDPPPPNALLLSRLVCVVSPFNSTADVFRVYFGLWHGVGLLLSPAFHRGRIWLFSSQGNPRWSSRYRVSCNIPRAAAESVSGFQDFSGETPDSNYRILRWEQSSVKEAGPGGGEGGGAPSTRREKSQICRGRLEYHGVQCISGSSQIIAPTP